MNNHRSVKRYQGSDLGSPQQRWGGCYYGTVKEERQIETKSTMILNPVTKLYLISRERGRLNKE